MISGCTIRQAAAACGISVSDLTDIETNNIGPTAAILRSLEHLFRDSPCLNGDSTLAEIRRRRLPGTEIDWIGLAMRDELGSNRALVSEVAAKIRYLRRLSPITPVHLRETESHLLVSMLDVDDPNCVADVAFSLGLTEEQAEILLQGTAVSSSRRHRAMRLLAA